MSNEALTWAFRQELPMTEKFVLVSLADYADDEHSCCPTYAEMAKRVGCCQRTVRRAIASLAEAGFLRVVPRRLANGSRSSNLFVLSVGTTPAEETAGLKPRKTLAASARRPVSARVRLNTYQRDGYACVLCGSHDDLTLDHIIPVTAGGTNDPDNLQTMCRPCNSRKGVTQWPSSEDR